MQFLYNFFSNACSQCTKIIFFNFFLIPFSPVSIIICWRSFLKITLFSIINVFLFLFLYFTVKFYLNAVFLFFSFFSFILLFACNNHFTFSRKKKPTVHYAIISHSLARSSKSKWKNHNHTRAQNISNWRHTVWCMNAQVIQKIVFFFSVIFFDQKFVFSGALSILVFFIIKFLLFFVSIQTKISEIVCRLLFIDSVKFYYFFSSNQKLLLFLDCGWYVVA